MKDSKIKTYLKIILNFIFVITVVLLLFLVLPKLLSFFLPFVIGWIVAMVANPLVRFLEKKVKILRKHSSAIIIIIVVAAIVGTIYLVVAILVRESVQLVKDLPTITQQAGDKFNEFMLYIRKISGTMPSNIQDMIDKITVGVRDSINAYVDNLEVDLMDKAGDFAVDVAEGFLIAIVTILSAYFFTANRDELVAGMKKRFPESVINYWNLVYDNFIRAFAGYFKAQFKIMLVLIGIMFIGFEILRVDYSFVIAFGIAILDLLPVFGTGAILWPWALIDMVSGNYIRAVGLVIIYLICQVVKQLLQPKMVGDSIGLHPLATLVFLFIGYKLFGVLGMIIGIPVGMVLVNMYRIGMFDRIFRGFKIIAKDLNEFRKF